MFKKMKKLLALLAVLALGLGVLPAAPAPAVAAEGESRVVKIACIGASTTLGAFTNTSWPAEMQKIVGGLCDVRNFGVNSRTAMKNGIETYFPGEDMDYTRTNEYKSSLEFKADYVLIMLGGNDAKPYNWKDGDNTFVEDYKAIVNSYLSQEQQPEVIVVIEPWVRSDNTDIKESVMAESVRPAYKAIAEEMGLRTIDLFTPMEGRRELYGDDVHPNAEGYTLMGQTVAAQLKEWGIVPQGSENVPYGPSSSVGDFYGVFDGYDVMQWKNGTTGNLNYASGMLAEQLGLENGTVVQNLTINVSYYWDAAPGTGGNDWWHFNTTDKDGLTAPSIDGGNPHDSGFGTFGAYGMVRRAWSTLTVSRDEQTLGGAGSDWYVGVGALESNHSLYIRGFEIKATLADGTVKSLTWGTMRGRRGADDGKTLKIACVGASTTTGRQVKEDKGTSYPAFLQEMLGGSCEVKNFGYPGTSVTKGQGLSYIGSSYYTNSLAYMADVVIIDIGGNDSQAGLWNKGTFAADYEEIINAYRNQGNDPLILISTGGYCIESEEYVPTWGVPGKTTIGKWGTDDDTLRDKVQPAQLAVAEKYGLPTADLRALLMSDPDAYICKEDGVHYTDVGYKAMAQMYYDILLPMLEFPADRGALRDALEDEITYLTGFTAASIAAYQAALDKAKTVMDDAKATQEEIDAAAEALVAAKNGLTVAAMLGDVDGDDEVTSTDARLVLQYYAGKIEADDLDLEAADVDGDSEYTSTDARLILQLYAGKIEDFPI